jgi:hypothetical protein
MSSIIVDGWINYHIHTYIQCGTIIFYFIFHIPISCIHLFDQLLDALVSRFFLF